MNEFVTWSMLTVYATFVFFVYVFVNFTKEMSFIKPMPTKYYSASVAFVFLTIVNIFNGTFRFPDLFIYMLSGIIISMNANGIADFNKSKNIPSDNSTIVINNSTPLSTPPSPTLATPVEKTPDNTNIPTV